MCLEFSDSGNSSSDLSEYESDGDMEDSLSPSSPNKRLTDLAETPLQLKDYMSLMDRELAQTSVGESFVRQPPTQGATDKAYYTLLIFSSCKSILDVFNADLPIPLCPLLTFHHITYDLSPLSSVLDYSFLVADIRPVLPDVFLDAVVPPRVLPSFHSPDVTSFFGRWASPTLSLPTSRPLTITLPQSSH